MTNKIHNTTHSNFIGFGTSQARLRVYIENIPPLPEYQELTLITPLHKGDIKRIGELTGNHWRKIFNVFAKLLFEYHPKSFKSWQDLRDEYLLQNNSNECLLFSNISFNEIQKNNKSETGKTITLIMGKTYAKKLGIDEHCYWLSETFAINTSNNIIICPYFDYRQLSNSKITQLVQLIKQLEA